MIPFVLSCTFPSIGGGLLGRDVLAFVHTVCDGCLARERYKKKPPPDELRNDQQQYKTCDLV